MYLSEAEATSDRLERKAGVLVRTRGDFRQAGRKNKCPCPNPRGLRTGWKKKQVSLSEAEWTLDKAVEKTSIFVQSRGDFGQAGRKSSRNCPNPRRL
ncbi:hypothetical protein J7E81_02100 [Bacillus sp. ISL-18]|uniref:hypothetical protein n=1 Tax=Bacillus sp. ISL-18 TaxID=2819118 RepID=UPI001BE820EB|nr:hypothetical protein [Bacillus sp. ISL-18]MBT2654037.1 hypothetical protein [Bacillus sp. ISL-18]